MSHFGIAVLFDRAGGKLTKEMLAVLDKVKSQGAHAERLVAEVRRRWDEWDLREESSKDEMLQFDTFYNAFMAPYFSCYRCNDTRRGLQAMDIDADGQIDWNEFRVYLEWALHQYPDMRDADELLEVAFVKGLVPAMRDERLRAEQA